MIISKPRGGLFSKKRLLVTAGIVVGVSVLAVGGWWGTAELSMQKYRQQLGDFTSQAKNSLNSGIQKLKDETDPTKRLTIVVDLTKTASAKKLAQPELPRIIGITAGSDQDKSARGDMQAKLQKFAATIDASKALLTYQAATTKTLQALTTKTGNDANEQKALADAWQVGITELGNIATPTDAKATHTNLIQAVSGVQTVLATLPALYTNKDAAGFAAKQKELDTKIAELRVMAEGFKAISVAQDQSLAKDYASLLSVFK